MKKLIAVTLFIIAPVVAAADFFELSQKVYCNDIKVVFDLIRTEFKQTPIWYGDIKPNGKAILFINDKTGTWSHVIIVNDKACLTNIGEGFAIRAIEENKPKL